MKNLPFLTVYDPIGSSEGTLDPLGLYLIADQLAMKLVPGVRERMIRVRFLTPMAVGALVTEGLQSNPRHPETPPFLVWEWLVVEAIIRSFIDDPEQNIWGLPGRIVVRRAITQYNYVDHRSYLKTPTVFGFHGVYKRLAVYLGIVDTQMRICEATGLALIDVWSQSQGLGNFDHSHELCRLWRKAVETSIAKTPVRTNAPFKTDEWRQLAELFLPHGAHKKEKTCLRRMLLSNESSKFGALKDIWQLCGDLDDNDVDERTFHQLLKENAPQHAVLLTAVRAYEYFCRLLTDAFDTLRYAASCSDATGCKFTAVEQDKQFTDIAAQTHVAFKTAADCLANHSQDMEERFKSRFSRFADSLSSNAFAKELCEHHEWIQQSKSIDGKRAWFDRVGPGTIYMRPNYRISELPGVKEGFVHEYRTKPILRFYRDLT